ncbi:MAG TPA: peptidylprolyl isomerase [Parachlamydiales bacterium]|nr:peptidylprolyl isomerase [Parachlamydiales bacterium]
MGKFVRLLACFAALVLPLFQCLAKEEVNSMKDKHPVVVIETNLGSFELTLKPDVAPKTCENFLGLVEKGYYNGTIFHRVIKSFMIQGGDPTGTGRGGESIWGKSFADEVSPTVKFDKPYLLAMANRGPNTNGSQFFVTTAATPWLNMKHTIFGEVTSGQDVVKKIEQTPTDPQDRPVEPVRIIKASVKPAA